MSEEVRSKSPYALKAQADEATQKRRYQFNTRAQSKLRRYCSFCKGSLTGRRSHGFPSAGGRQIACGACKKP